MSLMGTPEDIRLEINAVYLKTDWIQLKIMIFYVNFKKSVLGSYVLASPIQRHMT